MRRSIFYLFVIFITTVSCNAQLKKLANADVENDFGPAAIWGPGMSIMQAIRDSCSQNNYPDFGKCFVEQMQKSGASKEAVQFAKMTGNQGYMRDFSETGKVDIAFAVYPFRANENQLCFLVNGSPNMINIDDYNLMPISELKKNEVYQKIIRRYPNVSIWPGDRSGTKFPVSYHFSNGAQQFIFNYKLQDGCHACKLVGFANLAFNFDNHGKYQGIKVVEVIEADQYRKGNITVNGFSKSGKKIMAKEGAQFNIILESNRTTGYEWQIIKPLNNKIVKLVGKEYLPGQTTMPGSGGKEVWNFVGAGKGQVDIIFDYLRPWEKNIKPAKIDTFHVLIK